MTVATSFIGARRLTAQNDEALAFDIHVGTSSWLCCLYLLVLLFAELEIWPGPGDDSLYPVGCKYSGWSLEALLGRKSFAGQENQQSASCLPFFAFCFLTVEEPATKSLQYCENIAMKLKNVNHLPAACHKYSSVVSKLEQSVAHEQQGMNVAFAGMSPGQAQRAKNSRLQGRETQAQFQRRMTRSHKMSGNYN